MTIKLKGSSDGSVSFDAPADTSPSGSDITLTLPTSAGSANQFLKNSGTAGTLEYSSMVETSTGVGIGTSSPDTSLNISSTGNGYRFKIDDTTNDHTVGLYSDSTTPRFVSVNNAESSYKPLTLSGSDLRFWIGSTEKARLDSSGRLLAGGTSARTNFDNGSASPQVQIENVSDGNKSSIALIHNENFLSDSSALNFGKTRGGSVGDNSALNQAGDRLGSITFQGNDGTEFVQAASIQGLTDASPGANDMPGRLVFSTTADGASSPTERVRITSGGRLLIGKTSGAFDNEGHLFGAGGDVDHVRDGNTVMFINRLSNDGSLVNFYQAGSLEGTISVSGSTVSYNGGHLARWSQLPSGAERTEILRGSVLSNLDEMCEWGEEDNEQLNRMKVSDVEGDVNVAGVFQAWDDDDDTYTNDFYCAMTGDFVIRIAQGTTVARGDLLMSAGDGTAKPQDDDIVRSKTIAKVTSTTVSTTYSDGSYCVPCVLMAC